MPKLDNFFLPSIYPITDRYVSGISHSDQLKSLIDAGASFVQIRDKSATSLELCREVEQCLKIARDRGVKLIINDRVDVVLALNADGVHLGQDDLPPSEARRILGERAIIGYSTHNVDQAIAAIELPIDYIAIGPVFTSKTKTDHEKPIGISGIEFVRKSIGKMPLVAIGGIGRDNIANVILSGADSVALISALVGEPKMIADNFRIALEKAGQVS